MDHRLKNLLLSAYSPCESFATACHEMRWSPGDGHVPRGFCGATGRLEDVRLVLVVAEPGDPHIGEHHPDSPETALKSTYDHAYRCFRDSKDLFHRNMRLILNLCWPNKSFDEQLQVSWITESVLCSAKHEGAHVPSTVARACRARFLEAQIEFFPNAVVVALGGKAANRLKGLRFIAAGSIAPPGCNQPAVRSSWEQATAEVRRRVV